MGDEKTSVVTATLPGCICRLSIKINPGGEGDITL